MDPIIQELLRYGWQGLVVAVVLGLARLIWPVLTAVLPTWLSSRRAREEKLLKALQSATKAIVEATAAAEATRQELARLTRCTEDAQADLSFIAAQLEIERPRKMRNADTDRGEQQRAA